MDKFGEIEQREPVFTGSVFNKYVNSIEHLPEAATASVGDCYLLLKYHDGYKPGIIYILKEVDGAKFWCDLTVVESGSLIWDAVDGSGSSNFWKRLAPDSVILHWDDPVDQVVNDGGDTWKSATWDHDVIVRKRGSAPQNENDGEIVGISSIRNQYSATTTGFVSYLAEEDNDYFYRVFAVTKGGKVTPTRDAMKTCWTWKEVHDIIQAGRHKLVFRVGDILELPHNVIWNDKVIHAQIVDFDYSCREERGELIYPNSITFQILEVLGNMSFDNKELDYAVTADNDFKYGKKYFMPDASGNINPDNPVDMDSDVLFGYGDAIPLYDSLGNKVKGVICEEHPCIRYFENATTSGLLLTTKREQRCSINGNSNWMSSNIRDWMGMLIEDMDVAKYFTNKDTHYTWYLEEVDVKNWCNVKNGWFEAAEGGYHNVAPASRLSGTYIEIPPFQNGFDTEDGTEFLSFLMSPRLVTITDQNIYRYRRDTSMTDGVIVEVVGQDTDYQGAQAVNDRKFWLPSFEEIYGRRPVTGLNGVISTTQIKKTKEGTQFTFYKDNKNYRTCRTRYSIDDCTKKMGWYLRSCDPTTVGMVYYVPADVPAADTGDGIECYTSAHRYTVGGTSDAPVVEVGPAMCFTVI